jgi:hypothetical protein
LLGCSWRISKWVKAWLIGKTCSHRVWQEPATRRGESQLRQG